MHVLQCARCASPIGQGVAEKKLYSLHTDGVGCTDVLPTSVKFHRWALGFGQCRSHPIAQALRDRPSTSWDLSRFPTRLLFPRPFGSR